jgi:pimeloyl-ACP methyl ester carboxylesterase
VLLLHGGMAHSGWWEPLAGHLLGRLHPFALDRRGHGWSDWADPERYGWEIDLRDAERVASELDGRPWLVVGHSQGGMLAVHLAVRARIPIAAIVVLDAPLHPGAKALRRAGESFRRMPQIRYPSLEHAVRRFQPYPPVHHVPAATLDRIAGQSFKPTDDGGYVSRFHWKCFQTDPSRPSPLRDFAEDVRRVAVPALVVRGEQSTILSAADHAAFVARLPRGRGTVIAETTHSLHVERPDAVAAAILDFADTV